MQTTFFLKPLHTLLTWIQLFITIASISPGASIEKTFFLLIPPLLAPEDLYQFWYWFPDQQINRASTCAGLAHVTHCKQVTILELLHTLLKACSLSLKSPWELYPGHSLTVNHVIRCIQGHSLDVASINIPSNPSLDALTGPESRRIMSCSSLFPDCSTMFKKWIFCIAAKGQICNTVCVTDELLCLWIGVAPFVDYSDCIFTHPTCPRERDYEA